MFLVILPIIYMILIWVQSSYFDPSSIYSLTNKIRMEILLIIGTLFEMLHLLQFGILYLLLIIASLSFGKLTKRIEYVTIVVALLYGVLDEIHQIFVPFRSFSIVDLIKDVVGILIVYLIIHRCYFSKRRTKIGLLLREIDNLRGF